jgi:hypothetical protein
MQRHTTSHQENETKFLNGDQAGLACTPPGVLFRYLWGLCSMSRLVCMGLLQFLLAFFICESGLGHSLLTKRHSDGQSTAEMAVDSVRRMLEVRPSWCVIRKCGLEPLQLNWFCW